MARILNEISPREYKVYNKEGHDFFDVVGYSVMNGRFMEIDIVTDYGKMMMVDAESIGEFIICENTRYMTSNDNTPIYTSDIVECSYCDSEMTEHRIKGVASWSEEDNEFALYVLEGQTDEYCPVNGYVPLSDCSELSIIGNGLEAL